MKDTMFVRAEEIAKELGVSVGHAYKLIRDMNAELKAKGFMTISGRVSRQFYEERFYGISKTH
ncbi:MAG: DNA-binding protein [Eggerthellaceae bacterium]|nr:DNA-binding protein [Eggerthellaceae bacterium]